MKKIKSIKLLKNLPYCKAGHIELGNYDFYIFGLNCTLKTIKDNPDFFEITYEKEPETVHILLDVEVKKKYYDDISMFPYFVKSFYNENSSNDNPIISVKELTNGNP